MSALEDRRQRAREAVQDAMAPDLFRCEQEQIITAAEIGIEAVTRVKITDEALQQAYPGMLPSQYEHARVIFGHALRKLGFEVEE